jgi:hypothetical protein
MDADADLGEFALVSGLLKSVEAILLKDLLIL